MTSLSLFTLMHWRRKWQPTPGDLPDPGIEFASLTSPALVGRFFTMTKVLIEYKMQNDKLYTVANKDLSFINYNLNTKPGLKI